MIFWTDEQDDLLGVRSEVLDGNGIVCEREGDEFNVLLFGQPFQIVV